MDDAPTSERHFSHAEAVKYITNALARENVSQSNALSVATALVNAEIDGQRDTAFHVWPAMRCKIARAK